MPTNLPRQAYVKEIHAFRGFAAVCVVAAHAWSSFPFFFGGASPSGAMQAISIAAETIFHDSTIFFALISGLLFSRVLFSRGWSAFAISKLRHVVAPYCFLSLLFTYFSHDANYRLQIFHGGLSDFLFLFAKNLVSGGAFFHLWYIPVLCLLYLLTPFAYALATKRALRPLLWLGILLPLLVSRQFPDVTWKNPTYFFGAYLIGVMWGHSLETWSQWCREKRNLLIVAALVTTLVLIVLQVKEVSVVFGVSLAESAWYIQKLALAGLFVPLFSYSENAANLFIPYAEWSFPIYFLHAYVISIFVELLFALGITEMNAVFALLAGGVVWAASIAVSIFIARIVQRMMGKRSRMLLGA